MKPKSVILQLLQPSKNFAAASIKLSENHGTLECCNSLLNTSFYDTAYIHYCVYIYTTITLLIQFIIVHTTVFIHTCILITYY